MQKATDPTCNTNQEQIFFLTLVTTIRDVKIAYLNDKALQRIADDTVKYAESEIEWETIVYFNRLLHLCHTPCWRFRTDG